MKLLKIIFVILILVTVGEAGYYFYISSDLNANRSTSKEAITAKNKIQTAKDFEYIASKPLDGLNQDNVSYWLSYWKKGITKTVIITATHEGEIIELDLSGGYVEAWSFNYKVKLGIKGILDGEIKSSFYYDDSDLTKIKLVKLVDGKEETIKFDDLKIGDKITMQESIDLTKKRDNNLIEIKILKE